MPKPASAKIRKRTCRAAAPRRRIKRLLKTAKPQRAFRKKARISAGCTQTKPREMPLRPGRAKAASDACAAASLPELENDAKKAPKSGAKKIKKWRAQQESNL